MELNRSAIGHNFLPTPENMTDLPKPQGGLGIIEEINPHYIKINKRNIEGSNRGFTLVAGLALSPAFLGIFPFPVITWFIPEMLKASSIFDAPIFLSLAIVLMVLAYCLFMRYTLFTALPAPIYFDRRNKVVFSGSIKGRKIKWNADSWKDLVPATVRVNAVNMGGTSTLTHIRLYSLFPGSNNIRRWLMPLSGQGTPQICESFWSYLRLYMNGAPADVPPTYIATPTRSPAEWRYAAFKTFFSQALDKDGQLKHPILAVFLPILAIGTIFIYLPAVVGLWYDRMAPQAKLPPELQKELAWDTEEENPYSTVLGKGEETEKILKRDRWLRWLHWWSILVSLAFWLVVFSFMMHLFLNMLEPH